VTNVADETSTRDAKLVQYLNEAYGKEKELETALQAHISMTTRPPYKKRLQEHLRETKRHAKDLERRIKQLGAKPETLSVPGAPEAASGAAAKVVGAAQKGVALAKGPMHALRGTGEAEKMLKNAKTEYFNEAEEIANYTAIETLAEAVNDKETAKLARTIRREEERMASFLAKQIEQLTKAVVREEIPAAERRASRNGGARSSRRRTSSGASASSRSTSASSRSSSSSSRSGGSSSRSSSSRATTARKSTARKSTARKPAASRRRSTAGSR
jgi:ferritin-like metal-binding protein YciE